MKQFVCFILSNFDFFFFTLCMTGDISFKADMMRKSFLMSPLSPLLISTKKSLIGVPAVTAGPSQLLVVPAAIAESSMNGRGVRRVRESVTSETDEPPSTRTRTRGPPPPPS